MTSFKLQAQRCCDGLITNAYPYLDFAVDLVGGCEACSIRSQACKMAGACQLVPFPWSSYSFQQAAPEAEHGSDEPGQAAAARAEARWAEAEASLLHCGLASTAADMHAAARRSDDADRRACTSYALHLAGS